jgi:nicotinamidase-related amidase
MKPLLQLIPGLLLIASSVTGSGLPPEQSVEMHLRLRTQIQAFPGDSAWTQVYFDQTIPTSRSAIVITDMWDKHWCKGATERVGQIAAKMEPLLKQARAAGILVIHAPSDTMSYYANDPGRLLAENAPKVNPPAGRTIQQPPLPIDDSDGGCDTPGDVSHQAWKKETSALSLKPGDVISDKGTEIYNVLQEHHIDTVFFMGVHANMCILNRTFGMRQMDKWGLRGILVRDLTDAMYNPASKPYVSHAAGVDLVVGYIERYAGPTITSSELMAALGHKGQK